jgi:hypothetical protein
VGYNATQALRYSIQRMEVIRFSGTLVNTYKITCHHNPEANNPLHETQSIEKLTVAQILVVKNIHRILWNPKI